MIHYNRENLLYIIENHPYYDKINKNIIKDSLNFKYSEETFLMSGKQSNVRALKTEDKKITSDSIDLIHNWVLNLVNNFCPGFTFDIDSSWLINYKKNQYTVSHHHMPYSFAFVYFVRCPRGSSPLVFTTNNKKIKAEEGKVIIFPGSLKHHVPKNKCEGRIVLSGNLYCKL